MAAAYSQIVSHTRSCLTCLISTLTSNPCGREMRGREKWKTARGGGCGKDTGIKAAEIKPAGFVLLPPPCCRRVQPAHLHAFKFLRLIPFTAVFTFTFLLAVKATCSPFRLWRIRVRTLTQIRTQNKQAKTIKGFENRSGGHAKGHFIAKRAT